ncbi:GFA family protein [Arenibaculum pallidiluteum]|uniref:GFA family protein n=1 Tax=Arenibaculum pallidiluteum TaxID=2812559 RepID=UPI001A96F18A|nr:GFA family protein [Arenibaculum pallidiluteum]
MSNENVHSGQCFCGAVEVTVTGEPDVMGYCHCADCRAWSAGPVNAFTIWSPEAVRITRGAENVGSYQKTENSIRKWCRTCGGHLLSEHPIWGVTDVAAAVLPDLPFRPALHVNYASTVLPMRDGLPKQKDFPAEMGGSGELLPE